MLARHAGVAVAHKIVKDLDVRPPRTDIPASDLSGGNQQKIVIGKWLDLDPAVVLLDEPTRELTWVLGKKFIEEFEIFRSREKVFFLHRVKWKKFWRFHTGS